MTMNPEIKSKWVAALRSGEYQQGGGALKSIGKFCCLGVLCDIAAKEGQGEWSGRYFIPFQREIKPRSPGYLPIEIARWAGIDKVHYWSTDDDEAAIDVYVGQRYLSHMNDNRQSFTDIADHIEQHL